MPASRSAPLAAFAGFALVAAVVIVASGGSEPVAAGREAGYRLLPAAQGDFRGSPAPSVAPTPRPVQPLPPPPASIWSTPAEFAPSE